VKIYLDTIGCRLNQAEIETYARQFRHAGHSLVATPEEADLVLVNTCTVTAAAASDSRQKIRQAARSGVKDIVVTGCWSTLRPQEAADLPGVKWIIPNAKKDHLVPDLLGLPVETFEIEPIEREPIPGVRQRTRAFIKVQDGCDNHCTFCITRVARGPGRSRKISEILAEVRAASNSREDRDRKDGHLSDSSTKEVVLTGVHLGSWGGDLSPPLQLRDLVRKILDDTNIPRLRLSSLEPWDLDQDFFDLWENRRLCRQLHLPLQSGCASILRRMARNTTPQEYADLVTVARDMIPDIAITTDVITGFPGETEDEFEESLAFIRQMRFAQGHVFTYSARQGTPAAALPDQIPHAVRKERNARMRAVLSESRQAFQRSHIGIVLPVLWERASTLDSNCWEMSGLTGNYLRVNAVASHSLWNQITQVRINGQTKNGLVGQIL
jgi:threonylcarbamoyladenosine tRNA methylthiotransferase MtaB